MHDSCDGCRYDLGGGRENCRINAEYECRDGGGFELWDAEDDAPESDAHSTPFLIYFGLTCALIGAITYKWVCAML